MGAEVNTSEKSFFVLCKPELRIGAIPAGNPNFAGNLLVNAGTRIETRDSNKCTWLVCPHLAEPQLVYDYYMASGLITIVLGKCFCESCLDMVLTGSEFSEFVRSSRPMTDMLFQRNFINPLIDSNNIFSKISGYFENQGRAPKTWVSCRHLTSKVGLQTVYSKGGQIFIFESFFTCQDCFNKIPVTSLADLLYTGESLTDDLFQERFIDQLLPINYDSLEAIIRCNP